MNAERVVRIVGRVYDHVDPVSRSGSKPIFVHNISCSLPHSSVSTCSRAALPKICPLNNILAKFGIKGSCYSKLAF